MVVFVLVLKIILMLDRGEVVQVELCILISTLHGVNVKCL